MACSFAIVIRSIPPLIMAVPIAVATPMANGQTAIPSRMVKVVEFADQGRLYRVDLDSGKVTFTESPDGKPVPPAPQPTPTPTPEPPPKPPAPVVNVDKPAFVCLFVAPHKSDVTWLDDQSIRDAAAARFIQFRGFRSTEPEVDDLGFREIVRRNGVPCVVIQTAKGKVIVSRTVTGPADIVKAMDEALGK